MLLFSQKYEDQISSLQKQVMEQSMMSSMMSMSTSVYNSITPDQEDVFGKPGLSPTNKKILNKNFFFSGKLEWNVSTHIMVSVWNVKFWQKTFKLNLVKRPYRHLVHEFCQKTFMSKMAKRHLSQKITPHDRNWFWVFYLFSQSQESIEFWVEHTKLLMLQPAIHITGWEGGVFLHSI